MKKDERGTALIITLLLLTILTGIAIEFAYSVYINTSSLTNWMNAQKASLLARSGQGIVSHYINQYASDLSGFSHENIALPFSLGNEGSINVGIEDENSKFNINSIIYSNGMTNEESLSSLRRLLQYLGIDPDIALNIADWIDPDIEPRATGSEDKAKNSYLWSIDELRLIDGIDEGTFRVIKPFITIFGNGMININTAEAPVLISLSDDMTEALAERIIYYRETTSFKNKSDILKVSGLEAIGVIIQNKITVKSTCYKVITRAYVNGVNRVIESTIDTSRNILYWRET
jgi:general secretion pathway protein K